MMKHLFHNQEFQLDEILFSGRNKKYGAYAIRNESGNILLKAMFTGVAFFAAVAITPFVINSFKTPDIVKIPTGEEHILKPIDEVPEKIPEVVKPIVPPKIIESTVKIEIPVPTRDAKKETPATSKTEIEVARIGTENIVGIPPTTDFSLPIIENTPVKIPQEITPTKVDNNPVEKVDIEATFNGGINAFRSKVVNDFDTGNFEGTGGLMKTTITFIVEKDGSISNITAMGNNIQFNKEAEKTIKSVKGKWIPAKLDGENVRSYFKFPISMMFE